jgi:predicted nucleic acid-binding protein
MATMADRIVVDASAGIAMIQHEPDGPLVRRVIRERPLARRWVSWFFWFEVANSLVRRHGLAPAQVLEGIATLDDLGLTTAESDRAAVLASVALAAEHGLSIYDASYLALAERLDAQLLTLDAQLAAAAGDRALPVRLQRPGVSEPAARYQLRPWVAWSDLDRYVEAVREATIASAR